MAIEVKIINKIPQKVEEYKINTGATQTWLAKRMNMSRQAFGSLIQSENITIKKLIQLSILLQCNVTDLYAYEIIENSIEK